MPEVTEGNPPAAPPAPAPTETAPVSVPAKADTAKHSQDIRAAAQKALEAQRTPTTTDKPPTEPKAEVKEFPRLTKPQEAPKEKPKFDPANLPPELQETYKLMQADYTRKTQELAEGRKALLDERENFLNRIQERTQPKTEEEAPTDPREMIRQLRDEGRHDEADQLLIELTNRAADERLKPIEQRAQLAEMNAVWRDTVAQVLAEDKIVKPYEAAVTQVFNGEHPVLAEIRTEALRTPERIKTWVPAIMHFLAIEQHAMSLEQNFDAAVKTEVDKQVAAWKQHAAKMPARLVESGGETKVPSGPKTTNVREAARLALIQLQGGG